MPGLEVHALSDRLNFGRVFWQVHRGMDWPVFYLRKNHRIYFHDALSVYVIAQKYYPGNPDSVKSGLLHLQLDEACTRDPNYRKHLEFLAELDAEERRKRKKRAKHPISKELKEFQELLRKMLEIQRLSELLRS